MILTHVPDGLLVVRQPEHGVQTGLFAAAWGNEDVPPTNGHGPSQHLAATHHDDGWATWERRPTIDPNSGQPVQFLALTPFEHVPLYRAGIERATQYDAWAGVLVSMHGAGLYNDRYGTFRLAEKNLNEEERGVVDEFLSDMAQLQERLALPLLGRRPVGHVSLDREVRDEYLLLQVWDRLSLQYAYLHAGDGTIAPLPLGAGASGELRCTHLADFTLGLAPYPFVEDNAVFPLRASVVPNRRYRSPEDFLEALLAAREQVIDCRAQRVPSP